MRIVYGWYLTIDFMRALYGARHEIPTIYLLVFALGNLTLNTLNITWCVGVMPQVTRACADAVDTAGSTR